MLPKATSSFLTFELEVKNITSGRIYFSFNSTLSPDSIYVWLLGTYLLQQATFGSLTFDLDVKNVISGRIKVPVDSSLSPDSKNIYVSTV